MPVLVSRGTAFCASCRKASIEANRKVLSFTTGKPTVPPVCWRLKESLVCWPKESRPAGLNVWPGCKACVKEKGLLASKESLRKKQYKLPCRSLVPVLDTMLMEAPLYTHSSALQSLRLLWHSCT